MQGLLCEVFLLYLVLLSLFTYIFYTVLCLSDRPHFSLFQGLDLLRRVSSLREEAQWLETEGLQKVKSAVAGLEAEGCRAFKGSHISFPHVFHPTPPKNATIPKLPPFPSCPSGAQKELHLRSLLLWLRRVNWHQRLPSELFHKLWRWPFPPT